MKEILETKLTSDVFQLQLILPNKKPAKKLKQDFYFIKERIISNVKILRTKRNINTHSFKLLVKEWTGPVDLDNL